MKNLRLFFFVIIALIGPSAFAHSDNDDTGLAFMKDERTGQETIVFETHIVLFGLGPHKERAKQVQDAITKYWSKDASGKDWQYKDVISGITYKIQFKVNVEPFNIFKNKWTSKSNSVQMTDYNIRSYVSNWDTGLWKNNQNDWLYAHEFGHLLGLRDRYEDATVNGKTVSIPNVGWGTNIMASWYGKVEQRNINILARKAIQVKNMGEAFSIFRTSLFHGAGNGYEGSID